MRDSGITHGQPFVSAVDLGFAVDADRHGLPLACVIPPAKIGLRPCSLWVTLGEEIANMRGRRGIPQLEQPMDAKALDEYRRSIAQLDPPRLRRLYEEVWRACRIEPHRLPSGRAVQELVQVWRVLWKGRRRDGGGA